MLDLISGQVNLSNTRKYILSNTGKYIKIAFKLFLVKGGTGMSRQLDILAEIMENLHEKESDKDVNEEEEKKYGEEDIAQLKSVCKNFLKKESLEVGQIVKWKENLKNRKLPHKNQPGIVIALLDEPVISTDDESGSPYFLETLDIIIGIVKDDTFLTFYYDSRRFEPY